MERVFPQLTWVNKCLIFRFTNDGAVGQNTASHYCAVRLLSLANSDHSYIQIARK